MEEKESISTKISKLSSNQQKIVEEEIDTLLVDDSEPKCESTARKHEAYEVYAGEMAKLIAEFEVHTHTLPTWIDGALDVLLRLFAEASLLPDEPSRLTFYNKVLIYERALLAQMKVELVEVYVSEIKYYKRKIKKFNHIGVSTHDGKPIVATITSCMKDAVRNQKKARKKIDSTYCDEADYLIGFKTNIAENTEIFEADSAIACARRGKDYCEECYPKVIDNGYASTQFGKFVRKIPTIASLLLAIYGIISMLK